MILGSTTGQAGLHVQSHAMQDIRTELGIVTTLPIALVIEMSQSFATQDLAKVSSELTHCDNRDGKKAHEVANFPVEKWTLELREQSVVNLERFCDINSSWLESQTFIL